MHDNEIKKLIESNKFLLLKSKSGNLFLYYDKYRILIPAAQTEIEKEYSIRSYIKPQYIQLNNLSIEKVLIKPEHAVEIFSLLSLTPTYTHSISSNMWITDSYSNYVINTIYNGKTGRLEKAYNFHKLHVFRVIYLQEKIVLDKNKVNLYTLIKYGLSIYDSNLLSENKNTGSSNTNSKNDKSKNLNDNSINADIKALLDCDKMRCGLASYEREMLFDIKAGHWDMFENSNLNVGGVIARNPKLDIKKNGVIGIDFGTKSTVVVKQEGSNEIRPIRVGSLSLKAEVSESDYENPTIISCIDIDSFLGKYNEKIGRPETTCDDLFVSYNADSDYKNCPTENFYAYYSELKQWANSEKSDAVVQDINKKTTYYLGEECSIEKNILNPIEIYAYYIGMYINNMRNGIYLKYIMSFPVKYSKATKELIRKSFEKGLRKSLPSTIVEDEEIMSKFSVEYQISEPAAYAVTALEQSGFKPKDETEKYLYGIFDFGGGTTDFDFGVWRGADDNEYEKFNCDYVLECFGADSDVRLGGENILEMLAYNVFKDNKSMAAEKKIACALPVDQTAFIGGECLINNSQSANRNLKLLKEAFRPLWEQQEGWEEKYCKKNNNTSKSNDEIEKKDEYIEIQMYDFNGKAVPNCRFKIDTQQLIELIKQRIKIGVDAFFKCIEKSILGNKIAQVASEKIYIFLAGNSCKSIFVKELFKDAIMEHNKEYSEIKNKEQDRFELIEPLTGKESDYQYIPNAKTSVAYGLVKSRPGGKIYVKKNYETDSNEETRFKYYLGNDRRNCFDCKLTPMIKDENGENKTSYGVWHKFQGAGMGIARIYYTEDPRADSKLEKLAIDNIPFHEISFSADEDKYLFIRAVKPSVIEYTLSNSVDEIGDEVEELDIDKK